MRFILCALACAVSSLAMGQLIESFESETYPAVTPSGCVAERVQEHASEGAWALRVQFAGKAEDTWPGLNLHMGDRAFTRKDLLVFEVFNPGAEAAPLSCRVDSADGRKTFLNRSLPPGKSTKVEFWIGSLANAIDIAHVVQCYPYISKPRQDYVLYFDGFRIETAADRFSRLAYLETAAPPVPTEPERQAGCVLFARSPLTHVFANSVPAPEERPVTLDAAAAQGETESLALSFRTLQPLPSVTLTVSALTSPASALPETAVELGCVRFLDKKTTYSSKEYLAGVPVYIEPGAAFQDLPADTARTFWIRFRIPKDATPGLYRGEAVVRTRVGDADRELRVPIVLRVWPFALPDTTSHYIGEYYRLPSNGTTEEEQAAIDRDLADMRDHGMTSLGLCQGLDTERVVLDGTRVTNLGLDGTSRFERVMEAYRRLGFTMPVILLADSGQSAAAKAGAFGSPEYDAAYKSFWTAVQQAGKERGWPELIVQPVDEPSWQEKEDQDRNISLLKLLKEIPGMRTEQDGPADAYFHDAAGPFADVWNYNGAIVEFPRITEIRKQHFVAIYNNDVESYRPEVDRYVTGFYQKAAGIDGVFNWEYRGGPGDLYDDLDGETGDFVHNYPPSATSQGGPSVAWEAAREGADDLRYVQLLEQWIAKAQATPGAESAALDAKAMLETLLQSLHAEPGIRGREKWSQRWTREEAEQLGALPDPDAKAFAGGVLKFPNGWTFQDYDRARWRIAAAIVRLMQACGEPVPGEADSVTLAARTPAGLGNAITTLAQIATDRATLPGMAILDWPSLAYTITPYREKAAALRAGIGRPQPTP